MAEGNADFRKVRSSSIDLSTIPSELPLLTLQGDVPLPLSVISVVVTAQQTLDLLSRMDKSPPILWSIWSPTESAPSEEDIDLPVVGVVVRHLSSRSLGSGGMRVELEGLCRANLVGMVGTDPSVRVRIDPIREEDGIFPGAEEKVRNCQRLLEELIRSSGKYPADLLQLVDLARDHAGRYSDLVGGVVHLKLEDKWRLVQTTDPSARLDLLAEFLQRQVIEVETGHDLQRRVIASMERRQRVDFLRAQLTEVRRELESIEPGANELDQLADEIVGAALPPPVARRARAELERLRLISIASSEYAEIRNYIDWLIHIPWTATVHERTDSAGIRRVLDDQFYGQRRAKERISEYLSVLHRTRRAPRNVICLIGASGIGKTQLGKAIAQALRRPAITLNLGVLRSESALQGNRRTFPGAMPGRLLRQLRAIEVINPVCLLEQVDRLGGSSDRPDLSAIVLEIFDPTLNKDFWDSYLGFPYDLSQCLYVCTATDPEDIPEMMAERMEFIDMPGYLEEEKVEITFKHLWPRQLDAHNLSPDEFGLTVSAVHKIIREYTMEAGLSNLDKALEAICRNIAAQRATGQRGFIRVGAQQVEKFLGTPVFVPEKAELKPEIGVAMGVAWTQTGGDIMLIEALKMRGSGNVISTGSLGDVMRESIQAAHSYVRSRAEWLGVPHADFGSYDIHVHFPSGAIPKDGPSAGITVSLVIASVMSDRAIRNDIAMTGEVSLRGKVLPVGGIKEKVAAAHRVGIHKMIVPRQNVKDLKDVPRLISKEMTYIPVDTVDEVFQAALLDFDPSRASLEKLLRLELAKRGVTRKIKPRARSMAPRKRAR